MPEIPHGQDDWPANHEVCVARLCAIARQYRQHYSLDYHDGQDYISQLRMTMLTKRRDDWQRYCNGELSDNWLRVCAENSLRDWLRHHNYGQTRETGLLRTAEADENTFEFVAPGLSPEAEMMRAELWQWVEDTAKRLTHDQYLLLKAHLHDGCIVAEIAEQMDCAYIVVYRRMERALKRLRSDLERLGLDVRSASEYLAQLP